MTDKNENDIAAQQKEEIREFGSVNADRIHCLTVIGQIEGHYLLSSQTKTTKYEHVLPALVAIEETPDIKGLLILLNTVGGDVEAGLAISEMIASMSKPTVSLVLGGGQMLLYELIAGHAQVIRHGWLQLGIGGAVGGEGLGLLPRVQRAWKAAGFQMKRQIKKFCGDGAEKQRKHEPFLP